MATGMPALMANSRSSSEAFEATTPPPQKMIGFVLARSAARTSLILATLGGGGSFLVGYAKNDRWAAQLDANMWLCSGNGIDTWDIKVIPEVTHAFGGGAVAPFALTGVGVEYQRLYPAKTAIVAAVVPLGAGVQWRMSGGGRFFIEGIYYIASDRLAAHDFPLLAGFRVPF